MKAEVRVKTVGFFTSLQTREETKLVTPWTYHLPSWPTQLRGPPESPWETKRQRKDWCMKWLTLFTAGNSVLTGTSCFLLMLHTHCILIRCLLLHRSWCSWRWSPTSRCGCTHCAPPQAARPAAVYQAWDHELTHREDRAAQQCVNTTHCILHASGGIRQVVWKPVLITVTSTTCS